MSQEDDSQSTQDGKKSKKKKKKKSDDKEGASTEKQLKRTEKIATLSNELVDKWKALKVRIWCLTLLC